MTGLRIDFEWRITLFTVILVPALIMLGFWQLSRAHEKEVLAAMFDARAQQTPLSLNQAALWERPPSELGYLPVKLEGELVPDNYLLLDNRILSGRYGNEVVALLDMGNGTSVLINRGWVKSDPARLALPEVPQPDGTRSTQGYIYVAPGEPYLLAEQPFEGAWPMTVQALEMQKLAPIVQARTGTRLFPYPVRLDAGQDLALDIDWQVVNVRPEKHRGYAVQWFAMAGMLALLYGLRTTNLWQLISQRKGRNSQ
ncbi:MAG: SURF1 family protein [Halioglobus sp.]